MQQLEGTFTYTPEDATAHFVPGSSHYTIPDGYWIGAKYQVSVTKNVKGADGAECTPYIKSMVGDQIRPVWEDRSSLDWWGAQGIINWEWPVTQRADYYGNVEMVTLYPQVVTGVEQTGPWWFDPHLPTAMKVTYTTTNPAHKLYLKFNCNNINNYGWLSYSGPIESGVEFSLASLWINNNSFILDNVYSIDMYAANADPFDSYVTSEKSQFTLENIEVLMPRELYGWVDITDLYNIWQQPVFDQDNNKTIPLTGYQDWGTWDPIKKEWSSVAKNGDPQQKLWLATNGGLFLENHLPTAVRAFYTMDNPASTLLPSLVFLGGTVDYMDYPSGATAAIDYGPGSHTGYFSTVELQMFNFPGTDSFKVQKIEVYQKIPNKVNFTRFGGDANQSIGNIDYLMPGYTLTRDNEGGGIYNLQQENEYVNRGAGDSTMISPKGTLWAFDGGFNGNPSGSDFNIGNKENLIFAPWAEACGYQPPNMVGWKAICHLVDPDIYFECRFDWWETNGGGYQMERPIFAQ
jgi:hypothetical protein